MLPSSLLSKSVVNASRMHGAHSVASALSDGNVLSCVHAACLSDTSALQAARRLLFRRAGRDGCLSGGSCRRVVAYRRRLADADGGGAAVAARAGGIPHHGAGTSRRVP